jgi:hypothetical protein
MSSRDAARYGVRKVFVIVLKEFKNKEAVSCMTFSTLLVAM